ncbi:unnamed protein product [Linum trigynum]
MRDRYIRGLKAEIKKCMGEAERISQSIAYRAALRIEKDEKMAQEERAARFDVRRGKSPPTRGARLSQLTLLREDLVLPSSCLPIARQALTGVHPRSTRHSTRSVNFVRSIIRGSAGSS